VTASTAAPGMDSSVPMDSEETAISSASAAEALRDESAVDQAGNARGMIDACFRGNMHVVHDLITKNEMYASLQDPETGKSPLMAAAAAGNHALCQYLLERGAPWNAVDRHGQCAGNYATDAGHWTIVNLLVDWGVKSELILGQIERSKRTQSSVGESTSEAAGAISDGLPVEQQPSTKPDYLRQRLQYTEDGKALLDQDEDAVMMEWERPLMKAHAHIMMENGQKRVLNVGFGMGIIDSALQELQPELHIIIEAHPDVYKRMLVDRWDQRPNVRLCFGRWQEVIPVLIAEKVEVDSIFYDTVRCLLRSFEILRD
jgi:type IV protein arginine methyltransferase